ncbi:zinc-dependent metalloprotease [Gluconobacter sp.]|uniref:zinc-dependent metalloprotease n=1 Tax=Gluconobacter sp. TaxID=1876758 RepID=UPI0039EB5B03
MFALKCFRRSRNFRLLLLVSTIVAASAAPRASAQDQGQSQSQHTAELPLLAVHADGHNGKILVTLPAPDGEGVYGRYLYASALRTGIGSANIRLDHGMLGPTRILAFRRIGPRVAVVFENPKFMSRGDDDVREGVKRSFPFSVITMLDIVSVDPSGRTVVDLSPFYTHDTMAIAETLNGGGMKLPDTVEAGGKGFHQVPALSQVDSATVRAFADNVEAEAVLTFASDAPGREISQLSPDPHQISFIVHHSLVRLPGPGYVPRRLDIRSGSHGTAVYDFGAPLGQNVLIEYANRFRLVKTDPSAPRSRVVKPIVYYIDNAAPEPVRSALAEGVAWWNQAFEAAGYIDAFQVKILPSGVDPQDIRYNIVNWNERQTRSYSYGISVIDPRTGEVIRGNVVLEGLRLRQDIIIFEALAGTENENTGRADDPVKISLDRLRQLGVHEVGHTLGLVHNFHASTQDRASVMDYPGPRIGISGDRLDFSDAYAKGVGVWDRYAIDWLYGQPRPGEDPDVAAARKAGAIEAQGLRFGTDIDGRDSDSAMVGNNMWTDGADTPADLKQMLKIREIALSRFGPHVLHPGERLSDLRRKFVPLWLVHRYDVEAVGKLIGGLDYRYAVVDGQSPLPVPVGGAQQRDAIDVLLQTLSPKVLGISPQLALMLSSGVNGNPDPQYDTEVFRMAGSSTFDPLNAAETAAEITLHSLLAPSRLERMVLQHARDPSLPGPGDLLGRLTSEVASRHQTALERRISYRTILSMAQTRDDPHTTPDVALALSGAIRQLAGSFSAVRGQGDEAVWCQEMGALLKDQARLSREATKTARPAANIPPGTPIGGGEGGWLSEDAPI